MKGSSYWQVLTRRSRVVGSRCAGCGRVCVPPSRVCPGCHGTAMEAVRLSHHARVVTPTAVHVPPDALVPEGTHAIALVETPEGTRLVAQVVDCAAEDVRPGLEVRLEFRRRPGGRRGEMVCLGHGAAAAAS